MELRHLRYFLAVATELNFTRAAELLHMAVSPLSRAIKELENDVGGPLFDRGTRHVRLTDAGRSLVPRAQDICAAAAAATYAIRAELTEPHVRIGLRAIPFEARTRLRSAVADVTPHAEIEFYPAAPSSQHEDVLSGELEFATLVCDPDDARLRSLVILEEPLGVAFPDEPRYSALDVVGPQDLRDLHFVFHPGLAAEFVAPFVAASSGVRHANWLIPGGVYAMVAGGDHATITIANPMSPAYRATVGDGVIVRPLASGAKYVTSLAWRKSREAPNDLGRIIESIRSEFAQPLRLETVVA